MAAVSPRSTADGPTGRTPPAGPASPSRVAHGPPAGPTSPSRVAHTSEVLPAQPERITIPAIGVDTAVGSVVSQHVSGTWMIKPPESTTSDLERAYWWSEHAAPGAPSTGTTYIYGHACTRANCAFDDLHLLHRGEVVWVHTAHSILSYRVLAEPLKLAKTAAGIGASSIYDYGVVNRLVLVTCGYAPDGSSPFNWAVIAQLVAAGQTG